MVGYVLVWSSKVSRINISKNWTWTENHTNVFYHRMYLPTIYTKRKIRLSLEQMHMEVGYRTSVVSPSHGKYGGLITNGCICRLGEGIWIEEVQLFTRTSPILPIQRLEYSLIMELITNTGKWTQNELICINNHRVWARVYIGSRLKQTKTY